MLSKKDNTPVKLWITGHNQPSKQEIIKPEFYYFDVPMVTGHSIIQIEYTNSLIVTEGDHLQQLSRARTDNVKIDNKPQ